MFLSTYYTTASHVITATKYCSGFPTQYWYELYQNTGIVVGCGYFSVAIYIGVFSVYRRAMHQTAPLSATSTTSHNQQMVEQQQRLTVTLGIITLSTLIFFNIPYTIFAVYKWLDVAVPQATPLGIISRFSTIINVVLNGATRHLNIQPVQGTPLRTLRKNRLLSSLFLFFTILCCSVLISGFDLDRWYGVIDKIFAQYLWQL
uniref:G-protein coupled receptors family 1 profile domain-containing protein n=1 Tax=Plectus sambesii TaxID=2011161 RepID=A0A914WFA5_9BILA